MFSYFYDFHFSCPKESSNKCNQLLDTKYKFYLSFENSLCRDYVTEKLYRALEHYIIPIVYGSADYIKFVPPHSYINIENFRNIHDLANYLKYLDNNPQEYIKYFWWKKFYRLNMNTTPIALCKLCELLNNENQQEKIQYYQNIRKWWFKNSCKLTPNIILE